MFVILALSIMYIGGIFTPRLLGSSSEEEFVVLGSKSLNQPLPKKGAILTEPLMSKNTILDYQLLIRYRSFRCYPLAFLVSER